MPKLPPKPCGHPRCTKYATKKGRCDDHQVKPWNHKKTSKERGYSWDWYRLKNKILKRDGHLCQPCKRAGRYTRAGPVDHILNKARGGTDDPANLEAICNKCHAEKTKRESKGL